jgi:hypothetical protein
MSKKKTKKQEHSPTLNTVIMVEEALKNAPDSIVKVSQLKRLLPKQINHNTLKVILEYFERTNKIAVSLKGMTWIENDSPKLREAIAKGTVH